MKSQIRILHRPPFQLLNHVARRRKDDPPLTQKKALIRLRRRSTLLRITEYT
jgi:hypothetical protein